jgi:hypothetical protein
MLSDSRIYLENELFVEVFISVVLAFPEIATCKDPYIRFYIDIAQYSDPTRVNKALSLSESITTI